MNPGNMLYCGGSASQANWPSSDNLPLLTLYRQNTIVPFWPSHDFHSHTSYSNRYQSTGSSLFTHDCYIPFTDKLWATNIAILLNILHLGYQVDMISGCHSSFIIMHVLLVAQGWDWCGYPKLEWLKQQYIDYNAKSRLSMHYMQLMLLLLH